MATENVIGSTLPAAYNTNTEDDLLGIQGGITKRFPSVLFTGDPRSYTNNTVDTYTSDHSISSVNGAVLVDTTSGNVTITLGTAEDLKGYQFNIKKIDSSGNYVIVDGNASETIDGDLTVNISAQYESITIVSDGSNWHIL